MKPQNEEKLTKTQGHAKKPRFKIEKLEERIAPAKGGIPGPSEGNGNNGYCYHRNNGNGGNCHR